MIVDRNVCMCESNSKYNCAYTYVFVYFSMLCTRFHNKDIDCPEKADVSGQKI